MQVEVSALVVDEAIARAGAHRGVVDWSLRSPTVRRLGSQLAGLFAESEIEDGLHRLQQHTSTDPLISRAAALLEMAAILHRAQLRYA